MTQNTDLFADPEINDIDIDIPDTTDEKNYLEELVGEGKKYKDPQALAKSRVKADEFIEQLKRENAGLRQDLNQRVKMEEFLGKMEQVSREAPIKDQEQLGSEPESERTAIKPEDLEPVVERIYEAREARAARQQNLAEVKSDLLKTYGPNYASKVREIGASIGMDDSAIQEMAAQRPKAFAKLFGLNRPANNELFEAPPRSSVNVEGFKPSAAGGKNYAYFEAMRQKEPRKYWSPSVQNEMHRLATQYGDDFYK